MGLAADIVYEILNDVDMVGVIGPRLTPIVDTGAVLPSLVYNIRGNFAEMAYGGQFSLTNTDVQFDLYTNTYDDIDVIRSGLIRLFHNKQKTIGLAGTTFIAHSFMNSSLETLDTADGVTYRLITELTFKT